jgi:hypothetical protein
LAGVAEESGADPKQSLGRNVVEFEPSRGCCDQRQLPELATLI